LRQWANGISLDWTHLTAKHLGEGQSEKWLLTVVDQQQRLIGAWFTADTALSTAKPILMQLKKNGCKPVVVALDNLPPTINRDTGMVRFLKEDVFPESCKVVIQDLFHVVQNFAADFGSKEDVVHFHQDVTMGVRKAMRYMHHNKKSQVVDLLKDGKLSVSIFYHGTWYIVDYRKMTLEEIDSWCEIGVFHELFCFGSNPVVPLISFSEGETRNNIHDWNTNTMVPKYFADGVQVAVDGVKRLGNLRTLASWNNHVKNLTMRGVKCILPNTLGLQEWRETDRVDTRTGMAVVQQLFNSGGNESWHSRVENIGGHGTATKQNKHMLGLLGLNRLVRIKEDKLRTEGRAAGDPIGYDRWSVSLLANAYAEKAGSKRKLPVPHLSDGEIVKTDMPVFLRSFDGPVAKHPSRNRVEKSYQLPLQRNIVQNMPKSGFLRGSPPPAYRGPRTRPVSTSISAYFEVPGGGAPRTLAAKRLRLNDEVGDDKEQQLREELQDAGPREAQPFESGKQSRQQVLNRYSKWNTWACVCHFAKHKSMGCSRTCARGIRHCEMQRSRCAELNRKYLKPKHQTDGELIKYLPSAFLQSLDSCTLQRKSPQQQVGFESETNVGIVVVSAWGGIDDELREILGRTSTLLWIK
jgi:hypothetical protein